MDAGPDAYQVVQSVTELNAAVSIKLKASASQKNKAAGVGVQKTIPPSMLPINPLHQPLAKINLEKLESATRNKKKKNLANDDRPISHLKAKVTKCKIVAKKLF
ncbi:unnamed protein product [Linum trigynum]|uniref:Uncharacterized protein n=1 Tax=Linum trigynum TaxID=586398 RepID=A0AAV2DA29_9ROSI